MDGNALSMKFGVLHFLWQGKSLQLASFFLIAYFKHFFINFTGKETHKLKRKAYKKEIKRENKTYVVNKPSIISFYKNE